MKNTNDIPMKLNDVVEFYLCAFEIDANVVKSLELAIIIFCVVATAATMLMMMMAVVVV